MTGTAVDRPIVNAIVRPIVTPAAMIEAHTEVAQLIAKALTKDTDYGVIPGAGTKPTLLKPGAERLVKAFGCVARYHIVETERDHNFPVSYTKRKKVWANKFKGDRAFTWAEEHGMAEGLYRYVVRAEIVRLDASEVVGDGLGSCSTMETKYVDRPRDCENTVLKMAQKRALVAAVLNAFGLSDRFTQDVEDLGGHEEPAAPEPEQPEPETPVARTDKQQAYFDKLNKSSVWTEDERKDNADKVNKLDAAQMKDFLDSYVAEFNKRKLAEKEAKATVGDASE